MFECALCVYFPRGFQDWASVGDAQYFVKDSVITLNRFRIAIGRGLRFGDTGVFP